jgi:hypothetical protein
MVLAFDGGGLEKLHLIMLQNPCLSIAWIFWDQRDRWIEDIPQTKPSSVSGEVSRGQHLALAMLACLNGTRRQSLGLGGICPKATRRCRARPRPDRLFISTCLFIHPSSAAAPLACVGGGRHSEPVVCHGPSGWRRNGERVAVPTTSASIRVCRAYIPLVR